jgi:chromosomal replication initiation ATPase DnaA
MSLLEKIHQEKKARDLRLGKVTLPKRVARTPAFAAVAQPQLPAAAKVEPRAATAVAIPLREQSAQRAKPSVQKHAAGEICEACLRTMRAEIRQLQKRINADLESPRDAEAPGKPRPSARLIIRTVAAYYNVRTDDILSPRRLRRITEPRHVAMYLCKELMLLSLPDIGRRFNGRDHTTVFHAVRKVEQRVKNDPEIAADVARLKAMLGVGVEGTDV